AQLDGPRLADQERIGPPFPLQVTDPERPEHAATLPVRVEHHDLVAARSTEAIREGEPGDPGADDDDPAGHGAGASAPARCSRTTSASTDVNAGSALGISVLANASSAVSAIPRASMSR